jgi:hypothetical protein
MKTLTALAVVLLATSTAHARPYGIRADGRLSARGVADKAVRLQPGVAGWYLMLDVPSGADAVGQTCRAELRDVSPVPGMLLKWVEPVPNVAETTIVHLDPKRYLGSHTYRMTLTCGLREVATGLVHLKTPVDHKIRAYFEIEHGAGQPVEDAEIAMVPKGHL